MPEASSHLAGFPPSTTHVFSSPKSCTCSRKFLLNLNELFRHRSNMPKSAKAKHNNTAAAGLPYNRRGVTNVFKFNTNLGQHILKNPGG